MPEQPCASWSSESSDSVESWESLYRVVLLGDPGVGKTSLVNLFAGFQDRDLPEQQPGRSQRLWGGGLRRQRAGGRLPSGLDHTVMQGA